MKIHSLIFRIHKHTKEIDGSICAAQNLHEQYLSACNESSVGSQTFKCLVSEIYHIKTTYTHQNNERVGIFKGIGYVVNPSSHGIAFPDDIDLPHDWFEVVRDFVGGCVTVAKKTDIKIEGMVILKEVTIQSDMTVAIKVG